LHGAIGRHRKDVLRGKNRILVFGRSNRIVRQLSASNATQNSSAKQTNCRSLLQFVGRNAAFLQEIKTSATIPQHGLQLTRFSQYVMDASNSPLALRIPSPSQKDKENA